MNDQLRDLTLLFVEDDDKSIRDTLEQYAYDKNMCEYLLRCLHLIIMVMNKPDLELFQNMNELLSTAYEEFYRVKD